MTMKSNLNNYNLLNKRRKHKNQMINMRSSFMMTMRNKKGDNKDHKQVVIQEEEKNKKFKKMKRY